MTSALRRQRRHFRRWVLLGLFVGVAVAAALAEAETRGLNGSETSDYLLSGTRFLLHAASAGVLGFLAVTAMLMASRAERSGPAAERLAVGAAGFAAAAAIASLLLLVWTSSYVSGVSPVQAFDVRVLAGFVQELPSGRALLIQAVLMASASVVAKAARSPRGVGVALVLALTGTATLAWGGHSSSAPDHVLAVLTLTGHILAAAFWIGGLAALARLAFIDRDAFEHSVPQFSVLALWCGIAVAVTGTVNGLLHLDSFDGLLSSAYGSVLLLKAAAFLLLIIFGILHRRYLSLQPLNARRAFLRLAAGELVLMVGAFGLAVTLSRIDPPAGTSPVTDPVPLDAPSALMLASVFHPDSFGLLTATVGTVLYLGAARRLRRRGDAWPVWRAAVFLGGIGALLIVTCTGAGRYALVLFSMHMVQHMTLNMVAPLLMLLGAPMTLALRALPPQGRKALLKAIESAPVRLITHPVITTVIFIAGLYALYFTPLFEFAMSSHWGHFLMEAHFLLSGLLFFWFMLGIDPSPRRVGFAPRIPLLLLVMLAHTVFAMVLVFGNTALAASYFDQFDLAWLPSRLDDQALGGALAWLFGELISVLVLASIILRWFAAAERSDRAALRGQKYRRERARTSPIK